MHARAHKHQKRSSLKKLITVHVFSSYVRVRARIIMKVNTLVDMYNDSLSFKFYEDLFIGCGETAEINFSIHYSNF